MSATSTPFAKLLAPRQRLFPDTPPPPKKENAPTGEMGAFSELTEATYIDVKRGNFITESAFLSTDSPRGDQSKQSRASPPGANAAEWDAFVQLALEDLLPVVSNPDAAISPTSKLTALGKVPSRYNKSGEATGIAAWPLKVATAAEVAQWRQQPDYGICVNARKFRAFDCDLDNPVLARDVHAEIDKFLGAIGIKLPVRTRSNSPRILLPFKLPGEYRKRTIRCEPDGVIEFLGSGNQWVAAGRHKSGARLEWQGGLPQEIPEITPEQFERLWARLEECFAAEGTTSINEAPRATATHTSTPAEINAAIAGDPVAQALIKKGATVERGKIRIECPWSDEHTPGGDDTLIYLPAGTGNYTYGNFRCLHASHDGRPRSDFLTAFGIEAAPVGPAPSAAGEFQVEAQPAQVSTPQSKIIDIGDLLAKKFAPLNWVVPKVLPEGLFLLVSAPKIGKSWLAIQMVLAVATGGEVLGQRVQAGDALYLALEDNERRLQDRLRLLGADTAVRVGRAQFAVEWPLSNAGGTEALDAWLTAHPEARLVVVDVLERFRPRRRAKGNMYEEDYAAISALKQLSDKHRVAILVIHHTRKGASDDPFATVSGTQALTGGADGTLILEKDRGESRGKLHLTGRDIKDDGEFVVEFENCRWAMIGGAREVASTFDRQEVLNALRAVEEPLSAAEVATAMGRERTATSHLLKKMVRDGLVSKEGSKYWPAAWEDLSAQGGGENDDDLA